MRILLVDDDKTAHLMLKAMLEKMGHEVAHAYDGMAAWDMLCNERFGIVICDWQMPTMDGIELCKQVRAANLPHYVYLILITGKTFQDDLVTGLQAGADDFLNKPLRASELQVRIESGRRVLNMEEQLRARNAELEAMQARINRDLAAAAQIQQELLPSAPPRNLPVKMAWRFVPADELAGDIFNYYPLDDHHLGFYLVDVSGHGIPAAMMSVHVAKTLSSEPRPDSLVLMATDEGVVPRPPHEVVERLNQHFQRDEVDSLYCTMIYGVIDTRTGQGSLCQAGHPHPIIGRKNGHIEQIGTGGLPVGMLPDVSFESTYFQLHQGERLLLFSDGITECFDANERMFGEDRLAQCVSDVSTKTIDNLVDAITTSVHAWHAPDSQSMALADDASLLAIEWLGPDHQANRIPVKNNNGETL